MSTFMPPADTDLFASTAAFRQGFERGLEALLDAASLNLFILVTANAGFAAPMFTALRTRLREQFRQHSERLREALRRGERLDEADDDLLVFLKMVCMGFDALSLTEGRVAGEWEVQFNHLRAFRPLRNSQQPMTRIQAPFDADGFHFNKTFMQQEVLWEGESCGQRFALYYNKYPFVDLHCLLVPERESCLPQYHRRDMHLFIWRLIDQWRGNLPGIRIGYNALGAFASVNHLHYQLFLRDEPLPVENRRWLHNGGTQEYPVDCRRFACAGTAWDYIERLHAANEAYNLLYTPAGLYCMPRRKQGDFHLAAWSKGLSWYEMSGGMITFNHQDYTTLTAARISEALRSARLASPSS